VWRPILEARRKSIFLGRGARGTVRGQRPTGLFLRRPRQGRRSPARMDGESAASWEALADLPSRTARAFRLLCCSSRTLEGAGACAFRRFERRPAGLAAGAGRSPRKDRQRGRCRAGTRRFQGATPGAFLPHRPLLGDLTPARQVQLALAVRANAPRPRAPGESVPYLDRGPGDLRRTAARKEISVKLTAVSAASRGGPEPRTPAILHQGAGSKPSRAAAAVARKAQGRKGKRKKP